MAAFLVILWMLLSLLAPGTQRPGMTDAPRPVPRPELSAPIIGQIDRIVIEKQARKMRVYQQGRLVRAYDIALGFAPEGDKRMQGDGKTPEGVFRIDRRNAASRFHLSLGLDYPRAQDRARAQAGGYDPGGDIFIHGQPNHIAKGFRVKGDWTDGCVAIDNHQIAELFAATPIGTEVEIRP
ncbi:MAG: L,D-transpeptidase family protein [Paracoccus sp. (in: a-proteobacteria)]|nr:L,D-transpeptidase family protein [Paracoccus sp. (in: a-proteobacteria)]